MHPSTKGQSMGKSDTLLHLTNLLEENTPLVKTELINSLRNTTRVFTAEQEVRWSMVFELLRL